MNVIHAHAARLKQQRKASAKHIQSCKALTTLLQCSVVYRDPSGGIHDLTPGVDSCLNVRTLVHEYGGGDFLVGEDVVYFANFK